MTRCPNCKHGMKEEKRSMNFKVNPEIIVTDVRTDVCDRCGFAAVPSEEAKSVYRRVHGFSKVKDTIIVTRLHSK